MKHETLAHSEESLKLGKCFAGEIRPHVHLPQTGLFFWLYVECLSHQLA